MLLFIFIAHFSAEWLSMSAYRLFFVVVIIGEDDFTYFIHEGEEKLNIKMIIISQAIDK